MLNARKKKMIIIAFAAVVLIIAALVVVFCFVGKSNNKGGNDSKYATAPLSEIVSNTQIPDKEYENLDLSGAVLNIPQAEKLCKFHVPADTWYTPEQCTEKCYYLFNSVFDYVVEENPDITFSDMNGQPLSDGEAAQSTNNITGNFSETEINYIANDETVYSCRYGRDGRFMIYDSQTISVAAMSAGARGVCESVIHIDRGEKVPDTTYILSGEEYTAAQALTFAEKVLNERIIDALPCSDVSPTELAIIKDPDSENYVFKIQFEYLYEKTPYFHLSVPASIEGKSLDYGVVYVTVTAPERVGEIYNMCSLHEVKSGGDLDDKYIKLADAAGLASDYLAPYFKQEISEISLKYACLNTILVSEDPSKTAEENGSANIDFRPYWCFVIDKSEPLKDDYCVRANAVLVDMQTGEVNLFLDVQNRISE